MGLKIFIGEIIIECTISKTIEIDLKNIPVKSDIFKKSKRRLISSDPKFTGWVNGEYLVYNL